MLIRPGVGRAVKTFLPGWAEKTRAGDLFGEIAGRASLSAAEKAEAVWEAYFCRAPTSVAGRTSAPEYSIYDNHCYNDYRK